MQTRSVSSESRSSLDPKTLDLLFGLTRGAPDSQLRAVDSVDAKIVQTFAAGTVLIGLPALHGAPHHRATAVLFGVAVIAFLGLAYNTVRGLWSRRLRVAIPPDQLWERFWDDPPEAIKHAFVADVATGYLENEAIMRDKWRALGRALVSVGVEAVAIGMALALASV
jgi:hypothetical protein